MSFFSKLFGNKKAGKEGGGLDEVIRVCPTHKVLAIKSNISLIVLDDNNVCKSCTYKPVSEAKALKILGWTEQELLTRIYQVFLRRNPDSLSRTEEKVRDLCKKRLGMDTAKQELEYFEKSYTKKPQEAVSILFEHAMGAVPEINSKKAKIYFDSVKGTFGSKVLVEGPQKKLQETILRNLQRLANAGDFEGFSVDVIARDECAQINASFRRTFTPVRIWKSKGTFFACGDPQFK
jgi:hypothetical protein